MHLLLIPVVKVKYQGLRTELGIWLAGGRLLFCKFLEMRASILITAVLGV